ncbi:MAG: hypothetical protein NTY00_09035 [Deltaproteobacteria bacterium]|nr:hypothetical protein [Deltaproteobacteria bacterium]
MKLIHYKTPLIIATLMLLINTNAYADETVKPAATTDPGVVVKTEEAITHGAEATAQGIERGAKATVRGIEHGAKAVERGVKRGVNATAHGIERGAEATRNAAHTVTEKIGGDEGAQQEHAEEPHTANEGADLNAK